MKKQSFFPFPNLDAGEWGVICDFDGTITPFDVTDAILEEFASPEWEAVEEEWLRGDITARECMERQTALIRAPLDELNAFLDEIPVTMGFAEFVAHCRDWNRRLVIVSDGMDYAIKRVLDRRGLGDVPVVANRLLYKGNGCYALDFPYSAADCPSGVCKCSMAKALGKMSLLIGDGRSDCCLADEASFVLARQGKELQSHSEQSGRPYATYDNFLDVVAHFNAALRRDRGRQDGADHAAVFAKIA